MKTSIQEVLDEIETEHNNGVEISQKQLFKMLLKAKEKEKQQIIDANNAGWRANRKKIDQNANDYYNETFENNEPNI